MLRQIFSRLVLLSFFCCCLLGVFADPDASIVSVMEGDSVTLHFIDTENQMDDMILWTFKTNGGLIAKLNRATNYSNTTNLTKEQFQDRMKLDNKTGFLTITNTRSTDSGDYKITIMSGGKFRLKMIITLTVYARLPVPVIISQSPQNSSSCSVLCSVVNVSHVTLSWLKGHSLLSSISVSDFNNSVSLHLECLDDSYSCVANNSISNQTTRLQSELCQPCEDCRFCCTVSEAVTRLVVSALVGVAAVVFVVYDIFTP